jgi:hypothetical protein
MTVNDNPIHSKRENLVPRKTAGSQTHASEASKVTIKQG